MSDPCTLYDAIPEHEFEHPTKRRARTNLLRGAASVRALFSPRSSYACAIPGISLNDYSKLPSGKGWGAACTGSHTTITLSNGLRMTCRSEIAELATLLWNEVLRRGYSLRGGVCGCYNCRYISGTTTWSNHAWALAFDINWDVNPYTTGTQHDIPAWVVQLANRYGFAWGGDYLGGRRDYMHFEFMGTPAQAVAATNLARAELGGGVPVPQPAPTEPTGDTTDVAQIRKDQFNLNDTGFACAVDGVWGQASKAACTAFQHAARIAEDGVMGPATRSALSKVPSWHGTPNVNGTGGYSAAQWQQQLANHGWHITVDNVWGAHSADILRQFQQDKGIEPDGQRGPESWTCLHATVN